MAASTIDKNRYDGLPELEEPLEETALQRSQYKAAEARTISMGLF